MEHLVGISIFLTIGFVIWAFLSQKSKRHARTLGTIEKIVEKGDKVDESMIKALGVGPVTPHRDLKIGMILIAIAIATVIFGNALPNDDDARHVMGGLAAFPFLVGLVYCIFWFLFGRKAG